MNFLLEYEIWLIASLVLIALDVFLGLNFILLSFGLGAALTGASLFWEDSLPLPHTGDWESLLTFFGISSLIFLIPIRRFVATYGQNEDEDINKY